MVICGLSHIKVTGYEYVHVSIRQNIGSTFAVTTSPTMMYIAISIQWSIFCFFCSISLGSMVGCISVISLFVCLFFSLLI